VGYNNYMSGHAKEISIEQIDSAELSVVADDMRMDPLYVKRVLRGIESEKLLFFAAKYNRKYIASVGLCIGEAEETEFREYYPEMAVVYSLFVDPDMRGMGVGNDLMDTVESAAQQNGKAGVAMGVVEDNAKARSIYEKRGYQYKQIKGARTIKSHWDITNSNGEPMHVVVDVMPMVKLLHD